jgi:hypothetical protein
MDLNTLSINQINPIKLYVNDIVASGVSLSSQKSQSGGFCLNTAVGLIANTSTAVKFDNVTFTGDITFDVVTGKITLPAVGAYLLTASTTFFNASGSLSQFKNSFNWLSTPRNEIAIQTTNGTTLTVGNSIIVFNGGSGSDSLYFNVESGASGCTVLCASLSCVKVA